MDYPKGRRRPMLFHGGIALVLSLVLTVALWVAFGRHGTWWPWLGAWLLGVNLVTLAYYGFDKYQSRREGAGRVPELVLHGKAVAGGSASAPVAGALFATRPSRGRFVSSSG